jgi:glycosyltransferase involved in cell wall biosynthesis
MSHVSVVIPTLNRRDFLEQALETVRLQTHEPLECIVVDGGSTDGTREYLNSLDYDALRTIYREEAKGLSNARNAGIDASESEYVLFLDSDDILYPHAAETLVETLEGQTRDCAGAFACKKLVTQNGREKVRHVPPGPMTEPTAENARSIGGPSSTMFRRTVLEDVGGFDESFEAREDLDLYLTLLKRHSLFGVEEVCCERRIHGGQMSEDKGVIRQGYRRLDEKHKLDGSRGTEGR